MSTEIARGADGRREGIRSQSEPLLLLGGRLLYVSWSIRVLLVVSTFECDPNGLRSPRGDLRLPAVPSARQIRLLAERARVQANSGCVSCDKGSCFEHETRSAQRRAGRADHWEQSWQCRTRLLKRVFSAHFVHTSNGEQEEASMDQ